jgi:hypothetical protein
MVTTDIPHEAVHWVHGYVPLEATFKGHELSIKSGMLVPFKDNTKNPVLFNTSKSKKSNKKSKFKLNDYVELDHDNPVDVAKHINSTATSQPSSDHAKHLFDVLTDLNSKRVIPKIKTYLNKSKKGASVEGFYNYVNSKNLPRGIYITDSKKPIAKSSMSSLETYAHEVIHTITQYGIDLGTAETNAIVTKIENIRRYVYTHWTYKALLKDPDNATSREIREAKATWNYMKSKNGFVAAAIAESNITLLKSSGFETTPNA